MGAIVEEWLEFQSAGSRPHRQRLLSSGHASDHLAVLLPGRSYSTDMPVLYFPGRLMLSHQVDVLKVDYSIPAEDLEALPLGELAARAAASSETILRAVLEQRAPSRLTLIGKSLGTIVMAHLLGCGLDLPRTDCIWITPILKDESLQNKMAGVRQMSMVVAGSADPYSDEHGLERLEKETGMRVVLIEDADHQLDVPGNGIETLRGLQRIVRSIEGFMGWGDLRRWWLWS